MIASMDKITIGDIRVRLEDAFPGSPVGIGQTINGAVARVEFWEFKLEINLTERKVSLVDKPGEAVMSFVQQMEGRQPIVRHTATTQSLKELATWILARKAFVGGVLELLTTTMDPPVQTGDICPDGIEGLLYKDDA